MSNKQMEQETHVGHSHHHGHNHTHGMARKTLRVAFFLTILILIVGIVGGVLANSLAVLSDAGHTVTDLIALGLAWFAAIQADRPSNERRTFGYHRAGILAALLNALSLILIAVVITWEALRRFQNPEPVQPLAMFLSSAIGISLNLVIAFWLSKENHNLNVRAAMLHILGDIGASIGVIIAGVIIFFTGWQLVDPILSIGIAVLIAVGAWKILRETADILMESVPYGISLENLVKDMQAVPGVKDVHDLHVWSIAGGMHVLSSHVLIDNLPPSDSSSILQSLTGVLSEKYDIHHSTIQFECSEHDGACCGKRNLYCHLEAISNH